MENTRGRYSGHGYRKFFTVTDMPTGERFCALCEAFDQSIYKRLRTLIQQDIESNKEIVDDILGLSKKKEEPAKPIEVKTDEKQTKAEESDFWSFLDHIPEQSKEPKKDATQSKPEIPCPIPFW